MYKNRIIYSILDNNKTIGKYYGYTPRQAVSKAFSKLCRTKELVEIINNKFTIYIINKKEKILYFFELERIQLENPIIRKIGHTEIKYNFKNNIKLLKIIKDYANNI
jgi:hypothetical protein